MTNLTMRFWKTVNGRISICRAIPMLLIAFVALAIAAPPASAQVLGKNWRVYNVKPATSSFWDINKPQALAGGVLKFPIQKFDTKATGSFAVYLLNNYNVNITGRTFSADVGWTPGTYETRSTTCDGAFVRFEFQDVTAGPFAASDYWWSTGTNSLDLNSGSSGTLTVPLTERTLWSNLCGQSATDTNLYADCITGAEGTVTPFEGFTNAMKNSKQIGIAFGSECRYASGVALVGSAGSFQLFNFSIAVP